MNREATRPAPSSVPFLDRVLAAPGQAILLLVSLPVLAPIFALTFLATRPGTLDTGAERAAQAFALRA